MATAAPRPVPAIEFLSFDSDPKCSVLYLGPVKSGKTHNVLSWQAAGPMLLVYWDVNLGTVNARVDPAQTLVLSPLVKQFQQFILPAIDSGDLVKLAQNQDQEALLSSVVTIGFDTYSHISAKMLAAMRGADGRLSQADRGVFLNAMLEWTTKLSDVAKAGRYNFIATCHDRTYTNDSGSVIGIGPHIEGQFRDLLPRFFDTVLWTKVSTKNEVVDGKPQKRTSYFVHTVPPDSFRECGDGLGGGRYNKLPPTMEGTYPKLAKAWGLAQTGEH